MSARGRGWNSGMPGPDSHQNNRRELRRPMGGDDDLSRGMARMDPFNQYGQYGDGYGMQNQGVYEPPRPAPNAEGWSSGDDFGGASEIWGQENQQQHYQQQNRFGRTPAQSRLQYNQQQYQQQQQHQQQQQWLAPPQPSWNVGASEFVPKSNLSVAAEEFVPRSMARNTSQWAYHQQQQQQQHQQHQQHQQQPDYTNNPYGYQPQGNSYASDNTYGYNGSNKRDNYRSGNASSHETGVGGRPAMHYGPCEVLSDAIATVVFMPSKFERTTFHLAEKFNQVIGDRHTLSDLVDSLVEQCIKEEQFVSLAGRLCVHLAKHVLLDFDGATLANLLIEKLASIGTQTQGLLTNGNEKRVRSFITIMSDIYLRMVSDENPTFKSHDAKLADSIYETLTNLLTVGKSSADNIAVAAENIKLCGKTLEGEEKYSGVDDVTSVSEDKVWAENAAPRMDALISHAEAVSKDTSVSESNVKLLKAILEARSSDRWTKMEEENIRAREEAAKSLSKPTPRKSAAIKIEPDPNDIRMKAKAPIVEKNDKECLRSSQPGELTEEEMKFISEGLGEEEASDLDEAVEAIEESDGGMTEDIADAYEQFLAEQNKNGK